MKRRIFLGGGLAIGLSGATLGCSSPKRVAQSDIEDTHGWVTPPVIDSARRVSGGLIVKGHSSPLGRIALRAAGNIAYAVGADEQGRFEVRLQLPLIDTLFIVETRNGQDAAPAPYRMLVSHDVAGPIALLAAGSATRRLDRTGVLEAIDSDGRSLLATGHVQPGQTVQVSVGGGETVQARAASDGQWKAMFPGMGGAETWRLEDRLYDYPGVARTDALVERVAGGWQSTWPLDADVRQSTWFPDVG